MATNARHQGNFFLKLGVIQAMTATFYHSNTYKNGVLFIALALVCLMFIPFSVEASEGSSPRSIAIQLPQRSSQLMDYNLQKDLFQAVVNNDLEMVKVMVEHGANPNQVDSAGRTPLYWAAFNQNQEMVAYLVGRGADVNHVDVYGKTPLCTAVVLDDLNVVTLLLNHEVDVNQSDSAGITPLHWAAFNQNLEMVTLLVSRGADVNRCDDAGKASLYWAGINKNQEMVTFLVNHGAIMDRVAAQCCLDQLSPSALAVVLESAGL